MKETPSAEPTETGDLDDSDENVPSVKLPLKERNLLGAMFSLSKQTQRRLTLVNINDSMTIAAVTNAPVTNLHCNIYSQT